MPCLIHGARTITSCPRVGKALLSFTSDLDPKPVQLTTRAASDRGLSAESASESERSVETRWILPEFERKRDSR